MTITITPEGVAAVCAVLATLEGINLFAIRAIVNSAIMREREWVDNEFMRAKTIRAELRTIRAQVGIPELE